MVTGRRGEAVELVWRSGAAAGRGGPAGGDPSDVRGPSAGACGLAAA
jgi:hypothetical protein